MSTSSAEDFVKHQINRWPIPGSETKERRAEFVAELSRIVQLVGSERMAALEAAFREYERPGRPSIGWFWAKAREVRPSIGQSESRNPAHSYYRCDGCGLRLSLDSGGHCPNCRKQAASFRTSSDPVSTVAVKPPCSDCSIYREGIRGASCHDWGTQGYETCPVRGSCPCVQCCRFEFLRSCHPGALRVDGYEVAVKRLPPPLSEAGKRFAEGKASPIDIKLMLAWRAKERTNHDHRHHQPAQG